MGRASLCLNMIVRNEMANLRRCFESAAPHISCWAIVDTGSTDGTQAFIEDFFAQRGIEGRLGSAPFVNFEQARNAALDHAAASGLSYDYLLLMDADMELVAAAESFPDTMRAPSYMLRQDSAGLKYWNTRLLRQGHSARYKGVTHEYIDGSGEPEPLHEARFIDHATGSNRTDKFERDIRLLRESLARDPDNLRDVYYLARSLKDAGHLREAVDMFARRVAMGGWAEEAWSAQLEKARCLLALDDRAGFVAAALAAFEMRPHRAEPLYSIARHFRETGQHETSLIFTEKVLGLKYPAEDRLFVEALIYEYAALEELSISGFYASNPQMKSRGFLACDRLATGTISSHESAVLAQQNLVFYLPALAELAPSMQQTEIASMAPEGFAAMNPSVALLDGSLHAIIRTVNYWYEDGLIPMPPCGYIQTRNFLVRLGNDLQPASCTEIHMPHAFPGGKGQVLGFEDLRLFEWKGAAWCTANVLELSDDGACQQILARIDISETDARFTDWRLFKSPLARLHEKNWMPFVDADELRFVHECAPTRILDQNAAIVAETDAAIRADLLRGGSQLVAFENGWLCITHQVAIQNMRRIYMHRFVWFDDKLSLRKASLPFYLRDKGIEFAAGLAYVPDSDKLVLSFGVKDAHACFATLEKSDLAALLRDLPEALWAL